MNAAGRWRRGSRATLTASFVSCVAVLGACAQDLDASAWTLTIESPVDTDGLVPFCPSIMRSQNLAALRDGRMPPPTGATATLEVDADGVHRLTPAYVDPLAASVFGEQLTMVFDFAPIGTAYTDTPPDTWVVTPDSADAQGQPLAVQGAAVNVTRTLIDGSSVNSRQALLRYRYDFDCTELAVGDFNDSSNQKSCACEPQTITWRISGS